MNIDKLQQGLMEHEKACEVKAIELYDAINALERMCDKQEQAGIVLITDEYERVRTLTDELGRMLNKLEVGKMLLKGIN